MTKNDITHILLQGEGLTLECKLAKNEVPKSVWESYSAFANTIGGLILLGVKEDKKQTEPAKRFKIVGVEDADKIITDFWNILNSEKVNENILLDEDVQALDFDGKTLVTIKVPMADWRVKPVFLNGNPYKGAFKRNHEGDFHCTEKDVKGMIRDSSDKGNDSIILDKYTMDDVDPDTLHAYRNLFRIANMGHPWNDTDDFTFLQLLGGYGRDRNLRTEGLTIAGLMMFGKGLSVRERFPNFRMDYIDFSNTIGEQRYSYRLTYDGRWENNFYQFIRTVMPKLTFDFPNPFKLENLRRNDDTEQMAGAREALVNSIIHCDVFCEGAVLRVEKHEHHLCFRNPGNLLIPIEDVYRGGTSKARNPIMQNMLRMIGYGENLGSGFPKILKAWNSAGWSKPEMENDFDLNEVVLSLKLLLPANDDKINDKINASDKINGMINDEINDEINASDKINDKINGMIKPESGMIKAGYDMIKPKNGTLNEDEGIYGTINEGINDKINGRDKINEGINDETNDEINAQRLLDIIKQEPYLTIPQMANISGFSVATISRIIAKLKQQGLKREGSRKNGRWVIER